MCPAFRAGYFFVITVQECFDTGSAAAGAFAGVPRRDRLHKRITHCEPRLFHSAYRKPSGDELFTLHIRLNRCIHKIITNVKTKKSDEMNRQSETEYDPKKGKRFQEESVL